MVRVEYGGERRMISEKDESVMRTAREYYIEIYTGKPLLIKISFL